MRWLKALVFVFWAILALVHALSAGATERRPAASATGTHRPGTPTGTVLDAHPRRAVRP